jgi:hypothetical protein
VLHFDNHKPIGNKAMNVTFKNFLSRCFGGFIAPAPVKEAQDYPEHFDRFNFQEVVMVDGKAVTVDIPKIPEKPLTEFERAKRDFTIKDMLVISRDKYEALPQEDKDWVLGLGNKVFYFEGATLTNVALVRSW